MHFPRRHQRLLLILNLPALNEEFGIRLSKQPKQENVQVLPIRRKGHGFTMTDRN